MSVHCAATGGMWATITVNRRGDQPCNLPEMQCQQCLVLSPYSP